MGSGHAPAAPEGVQAAAQFNQRRAMGGRVLAPLREAVPRERAELDGFLQKDRPQLVVDGVDIRQRRERHISQRRLASRYVSGELCRRDSGFRPLAQTCKVFLGNRQCGVRRGLGVIHPPPQIKIDGGERRCQRLDMPIKAQARLAMPMLHRVATAPAQQFGGT